MCLHMVQGIRIKVFVLWQGLARFHFFSQAAHRMNKNPLLEGSGFLFMQNDSQF